MRTYLHKKFYANLNKLKKDSLNRITIAVSGGQDSLCLMKLFQDLKTYKYPLLKIDYVYIDHQWRKDSKLHIQHLINIVNSINETVHIYQIKSIPKSEAQARKIRYHVLTHHSFLLENTIIATAHTETDKLETFWQQILRGTTVNGISGLASQRILPQYIQLWRPMINFTRDEINWFCRKFHLPIWSDSTNYSCYISRNRLRNELIPYIKQYLQYSIDKKINEFIYNSSKENDYIKQNTIKLYLISRHPKNLAINYKIIKKQHCAIQTRILQLFIYHNLNQILSKSILYKLIKNTLVNNRKIIYKNIKIAIYNDWLYLC